MIGNGGLLSTMGDLFKWNENLDHPAVGGPHVRRRDADADAADHRPNDHLRARAQVVRLSGRARGGSRRLDGRLSNVSRALSRPARVGRRVVQLRAYANPTALRASGGGLVLTSSRGRAAAGRARSTSTSCRRRRCRNGSGRIAIRTPIRRSRCRVGERSLIDRRPRRRRVGRARRTHFRRAAGRCAFERCRRGRRASCSFGRRATRRVRGASAPPRRRGSSDYVGDYTSDELDVVSRLRCRTGSSSCGGGRRTSSSCGRLCGRFQAGGELGTVRFSRDANGRVTGLSFFAGRVLDVRFRRRLVAAGALPRP